MTQTTMNTVIRDNPIFFSKESMNYFNSKIESDILKDNMFVTSERMNYEDKPEFTVRKANGKHIDTVSEFMEFKTLGKALAYIDKVTKCTTS